jgi:hypothetical protein
MPSRRNWVPERDYTCPKCGYVMALAPLQYVRVVHRKDGSHTYKIMGSNYR